MGLTRFVFNSDKQGQGTDSAWREAFRYVIRSSLHVCAAERITYAWEFYEGHRGAPHARDDGCQLHASLGGRGLMRKWSQLLAIRSELLDASVLQVEEVFRLQ